jgi:hypothetical protein
MNRSCVLLTVYILFTLGCRQQTYEEQMKETSDKVLATFKNGEEKDFARLIGVDLLTIGKNEEMVGLDFKRYKELYNRYLANKQPEVVITNEIDNLGHRKVIVPFSNTYDSVEKTKTVRLELLFGPPQMVPLNKLSGYKMVVERNEADMPPLMAPPATK